MLELSCILLVTSWIIRNKIRLSNQHAAACGNSISRGPLTYVSCPSALENGSRWSGHIFRWWILSCRGTLGPCSPITTQHGQLTDNVGFANHPNLKLKNVFWLTAAPLYQTQPVN